tara:strand:+ start:1600 stop:2013 length:414 start_codon:yes stop_codon:yes gene_type:complete
MDAEVTPIKSSERIFRSIPPKESCIAIKGIEKPIVITTTKIRKISLLKYSAIISDGVTKPNLFESIHCLFEKRILTKGIVMHAREVIAKERPFAKIKPGCKKNTHPENVVQVTIVINDQPGTCLPKIKKSTGVIILF